MKIIAIKEEGARFVVECSTAREQYRVSTFFSKEPGTIQWLKRSIRADDVFLDIGANIGLYSLYAAALDPSVKVYAIEPHIPTAASLLRNVALNGWESRIHVMTCALAGDHGWRPFSYHGLEAGISDNQLGIERDGITEIKWSTLVDDLIFDKILPQPTLVKIDVDGTEPNIVEGMRIACLRDPRLRSVQVEVNPGCAEILSRQFSKAGFLTSQCHDTANGQAARAAGMNPESIAYNRIFTRESEHVG